MKRISLQALVLFLFVFTSLLSPLCAFAATYGSGNFGEEPYGIGAEQIPPTVIDNGPGIPVPQAKSCDASAPTSAPNLFQINALKNDQTIYFSPAGNADRYYIRYGTKSGEYPYGFEISNASSGVIAVSIHQLKANTMYYYTVRGGNGCATGSWSNELSAKTGQRTPSYKGSSIFRVIATAIQKRLAPKQVTQVSIDAPAATIAPAPTQIDKPVNQPSVNSAPTVTTVPPQPKPAQATGFWGYIKKLFGR